MSKWSIIATWKMALDGVVFGANMLQEGKSCKDAVEEAIKIVEDYPFYKSVGYGGLPNELGEVELDAAFMDGKTLSIGAVASLKDFKNPVSIARKLSENRYNIFLAGAGAEAYAHKNGFIRQNMLTPKAKKRWESKITEIQGSNLSPYDGHDTVCMISLDSLKDMAAATSTSGLFMKKQGRVGDSPLSGSGFYVDNDIGGAAATGLGEDIMKGCLSYEVVCRMKNGMPPQKAAQTAVYEFTQRLKEKRGKAGEISVIALNNKGEWGVGTNVEFSFVVSTDSMPPTVFLAFPNLEEVSIERATEEYMTAYKKQIQEEI